MRRAERKFAAKEKRHPRTLTEIDFLLLVNDEIRQGALRFKKKPDGPFLTTYEKNSIPPLLSLRKLLAASTRVLQDSDTDEDLRLILAPGSSLGGARPKASVLDKDGHLAIAKFPKKDDEIDVIGWEAVALTLAAKAQITTPQWRLESIGKQRILISRRFDRLQNTRIPFLSAMSALQARDNEPHSYLEIADAIRQMSASPQNDLRALWRRMILNILDLNPIPIDIKPRVLSTMIDLIDSSASIDLAFNVGAYFEINLTEMKQIVKEVALATAEWQSTAKKLKIGKKEIDRMASAFEHEDFKKALC